uniref:Uncharacterized protein n=1 Tax=Anguilla anguilla TaxID=7936 RepID=A0A0E9XRB2_ANGAN
MEQQQVQYSGHVRFWCVFSNSQLHQLQGNILVRH